MKNKRVIIATLLALAAGCKHEATGPSTVTAESGGRNLKAVVYGGVFVQPQEDKFIVKLKGHELVVEKARLLMDDKETAKFPAAATNFNVTYSNGAIHVAADGATVLDTRL